MCSQAIRINDQRRSSISMLRRGNDVRNGSYRVTVAVLGRCGLPTVGMPLFLPWLIDDELRALAAGSAGISVLLLVTTDGFGLTRGTIVRRCGATCERVGAVNGLLLTSWSNPFSAGITVEAKSWRGAEEGTVESRALEWKVVCDPR